MVVAITILFVVCLGFSTKSYDPLARYPYATKDNRKIIINHLSKQGIEFIIDEDIKPEEFLPFLNVKGFRIVNTVAYYNVEQITKANKDNVVDFVNKITEYASYEDYANYLPYYSFSDIEAWYKKADKSTSLIENPSDLLLSLDSTKTILKFEPSDLVTVSDEVISFDIPIQLRKEASGALDKMCQLFSDEDSNKLCGGLIIQQGYVSYDNEEINPGQNEAQTGLQIELRVDDSTDFRNTAQYLWLKDNSYKFGFILRYPADVNYNFSQPADNVLRYVGVEAAKLIHNGSIPLEEYGKGQ